MAVAISDRRTPSVSTRAYLSVMGGFCALLCTVGFVVAFGVFQGYYTEHLLQGNSDFDVSWIGSAAIFLLYVSAPICGVLVDKFGPKVLLIAGSVGVLVAIFMISLCSQYYQVFLAHGVLLGISMGFVTWPPMAVVSRNLPHHRGLALGVVTGGSSVGGIVWSIMIEQLLNKRNFGFPWTVRVVGFTMLPLLVFACSTITEPPKQLETQPRPGLEPTAESSPASPSLKPKDASRLLIRSPVFISLCVGFGLAFLGLFSPFFYIPSYAASHGASAQTSFYMISIMNAATLFGRVIPGAVADRVGHYNVMVFLLLFSGIISFCWTAVHTLAGLVIWSIAYGFSSGAVLSLQPACAGKIATLQDQGRAIGFLQGSLAVTVLVGSPIGGQLLGHYGYLALSIFTGATLVAGAVSIGYARKCLDSRVIAAV
ncbi:MFS transporter [Parastagonospora nodorum]|uniref:MFS transporter n=1 Tax=Phaeosphaeria nodorum (strain SN15 / ATCC MYA-4574 / FGSC 10173) TaxID=321614 RepID=A0A7U2ID31_PHANO|nr:MFS transporter [Parastagonospora nodorum]QRD07585.1 MFS transporter [Parastagonospora nodorum SN15]KAH3930133.1 MFS transporter [Parastagonospora nodorum]KAH3942834.1 MFS transporter [Parastagonospora nodorum]KAH3964550.1 MFS transporter [Parastagonospora nodorum]